ncbi:hypothetical protein QYF61_016785 [Mycteria americana]|uniref:Uncharacterized protein n=1 Tax=Mycteria americana TaxID=33587 RepID=A0AAN7NGN0_MYCAM|nr:hypothetical protein QYF61_016785 [Mycteria americana]
MVGLDDLKACLESKGNKSHSGLMMFFFTCHVMNYEAKRENPKNKLLSTTAKRWLTGLAPGWRETSPQRSARSRSQPRGRAVGPPAEHGALPTAATRGLPPPTPRPRQQQRPPQEALKGKRGKVTFAAQQQSNSVQYESRLIEEAEIPQTTCHHVCRCNEDRRGTNCATGAHQRGRRDGELSLSTNTEGPEAAALHVQEQPELLKQQLIGKVAFSATQKQHPREDGAASIQIYLSLPRLLFPQAIRRKRVKIRKIISVKNGANLPSERLITFWLSTYLQKEKIEKFQRGSSLEAKAAHLPRPQREGAGRRQPSGSAMPSLC